MPLLSLLAKIELARRIVELRTLALAMPPPASAPLPEKVELMTLTTLALRMFHIAPPQDYLVAGEGATYHP